MTTPETATRVRRRRSSSSKQRRRVRHAVPPQIVRAMPFVMAALALVYVGHGLMAVRADTLFYGQLATGMAPAEVRYVMGAPTVVAREGDDETWRFRRGETTHDVRFAGGRAVSIACRDTANSAAACPPIFGITLGTHEDTVWARLGAPDRQIYRGEAKTLVYDDLGVRYDLSQLLVDGIRHEPDDRGASYLWRVPRILLP